jgi:hypothetical protein
MAAQNPGLDPANLNYYGADPADVADYQKSLQESVDALQARYANPNWFNVAAGFLKPQLGGFAASLGSAGQAMGENLEKQRESMLPVAQMKAQLAMSKIKMGQSKQAAELVKKIEGQGGVGTPAQIASLEAYTTGPKGVNAALSVGANRATGVSAQEMEQLKSAYEIQKDEATPAPLKQAATKFIADITARMGAMTGGNQPKSEVAPVPVPVPVGTPVAAPVPTPVPTPVPAGSLENLGGAATEGASATTEQGLKNKDRLAGMTHLTELGAETERNTPQYNALAGIYPYFKDPGVKQIMGKFDQGTWDSIIQSMLKGQNQSGAIQEAITRVSPSVEKQYPGTVDKLQQIFGVAAQQQLFVNNTTAHPTVTTQNVEKQVTFGPTDSSETAAKKTILSLHAMQRDPMHKAIAQKLYDQGKGLIDIRKSEEYKKYNDNWGTLHQQLQQRDSPTDVYPGLRSYSPAAPGKSSLETTLRARAAKQP